MLTNNRICVHEGLQGLQVFFLFCSSSHSAQENVLKLIKFFLQKCGPYLKAFLKIIVIPLSTVFPRKSNMALIKFPEMGRLFEQLL